jgi:hypothetical protein
MFKGLLATETIVTYFAWRSSLSPWIIYPFWAVVMAISLYRMHHFGVHYARELFANIAELASNRGDK